MRKQLHWLFKIIVFLLAVEILIRFLGFLYLNKNYRHEYRILFDHSKNLAERINIVCLGESSTSGIWVDWQDSYPRQLERKLRKFYNNDNINVIVPPHVGQNTSQVANRIGWYIALYRPKLIILMLGANNRWSFAESHIGRFLNLCERDAWRIKILLALDNFRIFKMVRYCYKRLITVKRGKYLYFVLGQPESVYPNTKIWNDAFEERNKKAFLELWKYDVLKIITKAKRDNIKVILMTYHINPTDYLFPDDYVSMVNETQVFLVRNDMTFKEFAKDGTINNFIFSDNWHPNRDGYEVIADNVFSLIKSNNILALD